MNSNSKIIFHLHIYQSKYPSVITLVSTYQDGSQMH